MYIFLHLYIYIYIYIYTYKTTLRVISFFLWELGRPYYYTCTEVLSGFRKSDMTKLTKSQGSRPAYNGHTRIQTNFKNISGVLLRIYRERVDFGKSIQLII